MKLKAIFASAVAALALLAGCSQDPISSISGLEVSNDYITLASDNQGEPATGTVVVKAATGWQVEVPTKAQAWLSVTPEVGGIGEFVTLTLTAQPNTGAARTTEVYIQLPSNKKIIRVTQAALAGVEAPLTTVQEVIDGTEGKTYKVTGVVTKIANMHYGNMYINDGTAEGDGVYIYGTNDKKGNKAVTGKDNFNDANSEDSWTIAVGDVVTVQGPMKLYNGTVELVDVDVVDLQPSLIDVEDLGFDKFPSEGGSFNLMVTAKESPLLVTSDVDWLSVVSVNADGSYLVEVQENTTTAERKATISIKGPTSLKSVEVVQAGIPATGTSITEIVALADDSQVETLPSTIVVALTTRGAVLSDGTTAIYAYGTDAAALTVGDGVSIKAKKTTYNGVPELTDITEVKVDSQNNPVAHPEARDITADAATYAGTKADYIKLTGTLAVSGNYYNLQLDAFPEGDKQGSIVYPVEALGAASFDGKKVTVTGYFNGLSSAGKYINVIATKIVEFEENPVGTATNPYTVAQVTELILAGTTFDENIYIKGKISAVVYTFSATYGTATFWISDDGTYTGKEDKKGTDNPNHDFECYSVYYFGNQPWVEGNTQVAEGDDVIVCGQVTLYNNVLPETASNKAWIYSLNGATE